MSPGRPPDPPDLKLLRWVMRFTLKHGHSPTLRDVSKKFELSLRGATLRLEKLEDFGFIERKKDEYHGIKVRMDALGTPVRLEYVTDY